MAVPFSSPPLPPTDAFRSYSTLHFVTVAICIGGIAALAILGRTLHNKPAERALRWGVCLTAVGFWLFYNAWWNWRGLQIEDGLPLHICDLGGLIAPAALLTGNRWLRATLYFWAMALTVQGFIQPVVRVGPAYLEFWGFWAAHAIIIGCAVYDLIAGGAGKPPFRPTTDDYFRAVAVSILYLVVILPFDIALSVNYGYVGNVTPANPTLIDKLGPWPLRLVYIAILAFAAMYLVGLPWFIAESLAKRKPKHPPDPTPDS